MQWGAAFHCDNPDFTINSLPDGDTFRVRRKCLIQGSTVFRDMFSCCDRGDVVDTPETDDQAMELHEPAAQLNVLFHVLHYPPEPFAQINISQSEDFSSIHGIEAEHAIPFPVLQIILRLADKYALSQEILDRVHSHLRAYVSAYPLRVYGYAVGCGLPKMAANASMYLLHPPLASYSSEEIKVIPTVAAYHKLVMLHDLRIQRLKEVLLEADIFPHGYGECARHTQRTRNLWNSRREGIIDKIQAVTNIAAEMLSVHDKLAGCQVCRKAWNAAVAMLDYKCGKIPRRIDQIPE